MRTAAIVVVLTGAALLAANCGGRSSAQRDEPASGSPGPIGTSAPPAADLVLRTETVGGIAGFGGPGSLPGFSLYADGRAIVVTDRSPGSLTQYRLTTEALRRMIRAADRAGLATPRTPPSPRMSDAMYTVVTFVTGGREHTTTILLPGGSGPVTAFLARLDPARWPRADLAAGPRPYRPARIAVLAVPAAGNAPVWPFAALAAGTRVGIRTCTVLGGADVAAAERAVAAHGRWRDHGRTYLVTVRPLLPDENGCADLT